MSIGPRGSDGFEFKLGKLGLTLFVIGMVCLVFAAFQCGIMVGKDMDAYPEKAVQGLPGFIRQKIVAQNETQAPVVKKEAPQEEVPEKENVDLTFYDTLGGKGHPSPGTVPVSGSEEKQPAGEPVKEPPAKKEESAKPAKTEDAAKKDVAVKKEETEKQKVAVRKEAFIVQVISSKDEKKAEEIARHLKETGYHSEVDTTEVNGRKLHRVKLTGFGSRDEAHKAAAAVEKKVQFKCMVLEVKSP